MKGPFDLAFHSFNLSCLLKEEVTGGGGEREREEGRERERGRKEKEKAIIVHVTECAVL